MDENKVIEDVQPIYVETPVETVQTEEISQDINIHVVAPVNIEFEDEEIIEIKVEEAFPYSVVGVLDSITNDKDILIDGGRVADGDLSEAIHLQEALGAVADAGGVVNHAALHGRDQPDQHYISNIHGLQDELDDINKVNRIYSDENGLGEFRKWNDNNPSGEPRSGYFVTIVPGTDNVEICDTTHDVYGVSVSNSGFVGNQNPSYMSDEPQEDNRANDFAYALVGIVGAMRVRTDGTARAGEYVVPNAYGEATLSTTGYGYKVLSLGSYPSYEYVTIAMTPQSDALSRLQGSIDGVGGLENILIQINQAGDKADAALEGLDKIQLELDSSMSEEEIRDIINENLGSISQKAENATTIANQAKANAEQAIASANQAAASAMNAQQSAQSAKEEAIASANAALIEAANLAQAMEPIVEFEYVDKDGNKHSGAGGFVEREAEDHIALATVVESVNAQGHEIAVVSQKVDDNGAVIQHLVSHVDKYYVGETSLSYGLSYKEAKATLTDEYIYVCTNEHEEVLDAETPITIAFKQNYSYIWDKEQGTWIESENPVSTAREYYDGEQEGDLWYCWDDVEVHTEDGSVVYAASTLYRWFGGKWVAVATTANAHGRILTSIKQTADSIQSDVVDMKGNVSSIEQNVKSVTTRIGDAEGNISTIQQSVSDINLTIGTINGTISSLQQHANETSASINAIALGQFPKVYQSLVGVAPDAYGNKYTLPPVWDNEAGIFVFNEDFTADDGEYYFDSEDQTKYIHVTENGYDIYTIDKQVITSLDMRISEAEATVNSFAQFKTDTTEAISNISQKASANEASISLLSTRYNHILLYVSEDEVKQYGEYRYSKEPQWNAATGKYEFNITDRDNNGVYYMADADGLTYCKVVTATDGTVLYETYGLAGSSLAAITQKVDDNSAAIGMVVDSNGVKGSVIVEAINNESTAKINADHIKLTANDSITQSISKVYTDVSQTYATKQNLSDTETSINSTTDNKLKDYATTAELNKQITSVNSTIAQTADKISLVVTETDGNNTINAASIVTAINSAGSTVKIAADHVDIDADVFNITGETIISKINDPDNKTTIDGSHITTGTITTNHIAAKAITTNHISFDLIDADDVKASISSFIGGMKLEVSNSGTSSTITLKNDDISIKSGNITLTGYVTFSDLSTSGKTTINGANISTGTLSASTLSANYSYNNSKWIQFVSPIYTSNLVHVNNAIQTSNAIVFLNNGSVVGSLGYETSSESSSMPYYQHLLLQESNEKGLYIRGTCKFSEKPMIWKYDSWNGVYYGVEVLTEDDIITSTAVFA